MKVFDHIIVGTGQATGTLVGGLPKAESLAIIEAESIGGTCLNYGCTPTKALVASAKVAFMARRALDFGIGLSELKLDFARVMARMNGIRDNSGMVNWLKSLEHVTLFHDFAEFTGPKTLRVGEEELEGKNIYLNVGGRSRGLPIPGLDLLDWLDNRGLLELSEVPEHLIIIGGSYIGLEFAQIFRRFGAKVTVLEAAPQIMFREDEDVAARTQAILEQEGIQFEIGVAIQEVKKCPEGLELIFEKAGQIQQLKGSHLSLAVGRVPNSDKLNLSAAGIEMDTRGFIKVDDYCRTNVEGVYALGDVNGQGAFTHTSVNDAEIVLDLFRGGTRKLSDRLITYVMFTDPPLARVGLSEKEALEKGHKVLKATREMKRISRAKEMGETQGFVKLLVDAETDLILGASILGVSGDEVVNTFTPVMQARLSYKQFRKTVFPHPTITELMPWILDDLKPLN